MLHRITGSPNGLTGIEPPTEAAASFGCPAEADLVVIAIPFLKVPELTSAVDWTGKVVVDATNQFAEFVARLGFAPLSVGGLRAAGWLMQLGGSLSGVHAIRQD